jgi:CHAT domain-containing protein/Flp pilus assembly protein TadD
MKKLLIISATIVLMSQMQAQNKKKAFAYLEQGRFENAAKEFEGCLPRFRAKYGENDTTVYSKYLLHTAYSFELAGKYPQARGYYQKCITVYKMQGTSAIYFYAIASNNLGRLCHIIGDYTQALELYREAKLVYRKTVGKEHPDYATSCNNIAGLSHTVGNYTDALLLYQEAKQIYEKTVGKKHPDYATSCNNLGGLHKSMGDYSQALAHYQEAKQVYEKTVGKEHPDYATSCSNLAELYRNLGDYPKAIPLLKEAMQIREKTLGREHPDYAQSCNNLAALYKTMGDYSQAISLYLEAMQVREKKLGREHPDFAASCNNLASLYQLMGDYSQALPLYQEAKRIRAKKMGLQNPDYAQSCNNLAALYKNMGNYNQALPLYQEAKQILEKNLGREHPNYAESCNNLALMYQLMGHNHKAEPLIIEANSNLNKQIRKNFSFLTEKEKEHFLKTIQFEFEIYHSFALHYNLEKPAFAGLNYNNELAHKGLVLQNALAIQQAVEGSGQPELSALYNQVRQCKKMLSTQLSLPLIKRTLNTDSLDQLAEKYEKRLLAELEKYPELIKYKGFARQTTWQDVQNALNPGEAAIEFISFRLHNKKWTDSTMYCALVLRKEFAHPKLVFLFEEKQLANLLPNSTGSYYGINDLYNLKGTPAQTDGYFLYQLLWQPLEQHMQGIKKVYYTPAGLLHKVSFAAVAMPDKRFLSDKYILQAMGTTASIISPLQSFRLSQATSIQFYGGIHYILKPEEMILNAEKYRQKDEVQDVAYRPPVSLTTTRGEMWSYLPASLSEVKSIEQIILSTKANINVLSGKDASEESMKSLSGKNSPDIIHIATHGFFISDPVKEYFDNETVGLNVYKASENPLLRSGLLFAGGNSAWNNQELPKDVEDGILTAHEISHMFLPSTRLVVLSACETGLGEIKGSEGVFGLQRSFKMAGVDYIIMSLWQVPDHETSEMMQLFYKQLAAGTDIKASFFHAQTQMKNKYPESPFLWAAFVLIE